MSRLVSHGRTAAEHFDQDRRFTQTLARARRKNGELATRAGKLDVVVGDHQPKNAAQLTFAAAAPSVVAATRVRYHSASQAAAEAKVRYVASRR